MQREGGFGREETGRFAPGEEKLSTEDIARTDTERTGSARPAEPAAPAAAPTAPSAPAAEEPVPPRDEEMAQAPGKEPPERTGEPPGPVAAHERPQAREAAPAREDEAVPLLDSGAAEDLRSRWSELQQGFVDDPQAAVRGADELVAEVMQLLARTFAEHKEGLESQWHQGNEVATEDLRIALRQYRSFFDRLLTT